MDFSGTEEIKFYICLRGQQINVLNVTLCTFHALFLTSHYQICLCRICSGQGLLELIFLDFSLELASQFIHSFIHYQPLWFMLNKWHVVLCSVIRWCPSDEPTTPFILFSHNKNAFHPYVSPQLYASISPSCTQNAAPSHTLPTGQPIVQFRDVNRVRR